MTNIKRGRFTKAIIDTENKTVILQSICRLKEAMALWMYRDGNPHLPEIKRIAEYKYVMPLYKNLTKRDKRAWKDFEEITAIKNNYYSEYFRGQRNNFTHDVLLLVANDLQKVNPLLADAFHELINCASNYSGFICMDFSKQNFSVDDNGNLILRDIFCTFEQLHDDTEVYSERKYRQLTS